MKALKLFTFLVVCMLMTACGGSDAAKEVASKIESGDQLTQQDYGVMVDYCGKYAEAAQKLQDKINLLSPTSEESAKLTDDVAALGSKFPYAAQFFDKLGNCTKEEVGETNVDKINRLSSLTWFTAPDWAGVAEDSTVVGDIVEMPAEDTAGVIAVGDGEVVE